MLNEEFSGFSKEDLNKYFFELSKELKKELGGNANIELIVVGGASILLNYDFRESTIDVDAIVSSQTSIKFENSCENVLKEDNLDNILHALQTKENLLSIGRSRLTTKENLSNMDNISDVKKEKIRISVKEKLYEMKKNNEILKKSQAKEKDHEINI